MIEMTPENAAALRAKFPKSAIGKKPQPYKKDSPKGKCLECGGFHGLPAAHLDYCGHAAVTDRLLQVDPTWSWEPFALDVNGLPALDPGRNLWIRLTICGVTRPGVGDGASIKEAVGDAIRNAAMRFGVALDLWAKEDLDGTGDGTPRASLDAAPDEQPATRTVRRQTRPTDEPLSDDQLTKIQTCMSKLGITDRDARLAGMSRVVGRPIDSTRKLTKTEARKVIDSLEARLNPDGPTPDDLAAIREAERAEAAS